MATATVSKPSRWFLPAKHFKNFKLPVLRSKPKFDTAKENQFREVFRRFDRDGNGKISGDELGAYFASVGEFISGEEAQKVIRDFDSDGDNLLEFQDFVRLVEGDDEINDDIRRAFEMFELEKGCGCITPKGLQQMFNRLGEGKSYEECLAMIRPFDLDGDGVLDFHEFQQMMT